MTGASGYTCYACGATNTPGENCWLCQMDQPVLAETVEGNPFRAPAIAGDEESAGVVSGVLLVTVIVVCGVLSFVAPGLGIPLAIGILPALIRTITHAHSKRDRMGQPLSVSDQFSVFMVSVAGVAAACCAAVVAFFAVCVTVCFGAMAANDDNLFAIGIGAGAIAGLAVGFWCLRKLWAEK